MKRKIDFLIIGSGIAGLSYALKVAQHGKVCMITKANEDESNTKYAQTLFTFPNQQSTTGKSEKFVVGAEIEGLRRTLNLSVGYHF